MSGGEDKPTYEPARCPVCKAWRALDKENPVCQSCKKEIPEYQNMGRAGFEAVTIDHWHFAQVNDINGRAPINKRLCRECYLKDYKANYPDSNLSLADLPRQIDYT
ncbi:MAG: hypothetical protein QW838_04415 [Candidatus Nitrosotenuis sp.]